MECKYTGQNIRDLIKGHEYTINITKPKSVYTYQIDILYDITLQQEVDYSINYSSELSIKQNWNIDKVEIDMN